MKKETEDSFFEGKRPWSRIKDEVLSKYLVPYLTKVKKLNEDIILVDAFAGPGYFNDGSYGSPIILCQMAENYAPKNSRVILVNKNKEHHEKLRSSLEDYINKQIAFTILGSAKDLFCRLSNLLSDQTVLLYLDPFGLED
jgi:three-Cys-motif partner protein